MKWEGFGALTWWRLWQRRRDALEGVWLRADAVEVSEGCLHLMLIGCLSPTQGGKGNTPATCQAACPDWAACVPPFSVRAEKLRDDFRQYMPDLLPRLVALFTDAERTGDFSMVRACVCGLADGRASVMRVCWCGCVDECITACAISHAWGLRMTACARGWGVGGVHGSAWCTARPCGGLAGLWGCAGLVQAVPDTLIPGITP
jgi:hypothetical protein